MTAASFAFGDGSGEILLVADALQLVEGVVEASATRRPGAEWSRRLTHLPLMTPMVS